MGAVVLMQASLLDWTPPEPKGETFDRERDGKRLNAQCKRVFDAMRFGDWRTLSSLALVTGDPEASVSARLRDLRKAGHTVERRYVERGLHEYRLLINQGKSE
jgi:hypothetical protein